MLKKVLKGGEESMNERVEGVIKKFQLEVGVEGKVEKVRRIDTGRRGRRRW